MWYHIKNETTKDTTTYFYFYSFTTRYLVPTV